MSLSAPLPYFLKLNRCFANSALIMRQPTAPVILNTAGTSFRDSENRFFMMMPIKCESLGFAEFLHFGCRPAILE
jgi:hypothetical protein